KSTDGGSTWTQLAEGVFAGRCFARIVISPANPQTVFAAITPAGGFPALAAAKGHPQRNGPVGIFRSLDGRQTWAPLTNGLPNLAGTDVAMDPGNASILYAGIGHIFGATDNGIYKSINGGDTWTKLAGGLPTATIGRISLTIAPSNPQRLYTLIAHSSDASGG